RPPPPTRQPHRRWSPGLTAASDLPSTGTVMEPVPYMCRSSLRVNVPSRPGLRALHAIAQQVAALGERPHGDVALAQESGRTPKTQILMSDRLSAGCTSLAPLRNEVKGGGRVPPGGLPRPRVPGAGSYGAPAVTRWR